MENKFVEQEIWSKTSKFISIKGTKTFAWLIVFYLMLFNVKLTSAQSIGRYFDAVIMADSLAEVGQNESASKYYKKALNIHCADPNTWLSSAAINLKLGKANEVDKSIKGSIRSGADLDMIASNKDLKKFYDGRHKLKAQYHRLRNLYYSKIMDKDEMLELMAMVQVDQSMRSLLGTLDFKKVDSLIHIHDTTNMSKINKICAEIGFPDRQKVGKAGVDALFILLLHTLADGKEGSTNADQLRPLLIAAAKQGNFPPFYTALIVDRHKGLNQMPQEFGTYWLSERATGKRIISPIQDIEHVDQRRKEIGLASLASVAKKQKLTLPVTYLIDKRVSNFHN